MSEEDHLDTAVCLASQPRIYEESAAPRYFFWRMLDIVNVPALLEKT